MWSKRFILLLLTICAFQYSSALKNQTLVAVRKINNRIILQPKLYTVKPNEIIIGRAKYIASINKTGYVAYTNSKVYSK